MKKLWKNNQIMITALAIMIGIAGYLNFTGERLQDEEIAQTQDAAMLMDLSDEDLEQANYTDIESLDYDLTASNEEGEDMTLSAEAEMAANTELEVAANAEAEMAANTELEVAANAGAETVLPNTTEVAENMATSEINDGEIPGEAVFTSTTGVTTLSGAKLLKEQTRAKNKETLLEIINSAGLGEEQKQAAVTNMIQMTDIAEKETSAQILLEAKGFLDVVVSVTADSADVMVGAVELSEAQRAQIEDIVTRKTGISAENIIITPVLSN